MQRRVSALVVDENTLFREGLRRILDETRFSIVGAFPTLSDVPDQLPETGDELLLLVSANDHLAVLIAELAVFRSRHPGARIVLLLETCTREQLIAAVDAGTDGYLTKRITSDVLLQSLDLVVSGQKAVSAGFLELIRGETGVLPQNADASAQELGPHGEDSRATEVLSDADFRRLSAREQTILRCLIQGASNKSVARELNIMEATVKVHIKAILRKLGLKNRTQAAIWAMNRGLSVRLGENQW